MECVFLNNILIQILRFAYFLVTNSKGKNSFHRQFNAGNIMKRNAINVKIIRVILNLTDCEVGG